MLFFLYLRFRILFFIIILYLTLFAETNTNQSQSLTSNLENAEDGRVINDVSQAKIATGTPASEGLILPFYLIYFYFVFLFPFFPIFCVRLKVKVELLERLKD